MPDPDLSQQMREDWNRRAREDPHYYVAFGRREQEDEEFFATAAEVVRGLEWDLKRLGAGPWRALEIGCGPGRLMRPMSGHFAEIHGVDVSDEMVRLAREKLRGIPHARVHTTEGADLKAFADESFDFVYSYAVFQHIPSRDVVLNYLREACRVLKRGGILRCQLNGLPETAARYDTWSGVRFTAREIAELARNQNFQLLALEGASTQYMWTTWKKAPPRPAPIPHAAARIRRITNAHSSEPVAPTRGKFASISLWVEGLPPDCDLNTVEVRIRDRAAFASYLGPPESDGLQQLNAMIPPEAATGLAPVQLRWFGLPLGEPSTVRIIPPSPFVPRILSVTDGIHLLSQNRIVTGSLKITLEEALNPHDLTATLDGTPLEEKDVFCTDPLPPRWEINLRLPEGTPSGTHQLVVSMGQRQFPPIGLEVVG